MDSAARELGGQGADVVEGHGHAGGGERVGAAAGVAHQRHARGRAAARLDGVVGADLRGRLDQGAQHGAAERLGHAGGALGAEEGRHRGFAFPRIHGEVDAHAHQAATDGVGEDGAPGAQEDVPVARAGELRALHDEGGRERQQARLVGEAEGAAELGVTPIGDDGKRRADLAAVGGADADDAGSLAGKLRHPHAGADLDVRGHLAPQAGHHAGVGDGEAVGGAAAHFRVG